MGHEVGGTSASRRDEERTATCDTNTNKSKPSVVQGGSWSLLSH